MQPRTNEIAQHIIDGVITEGAAVLAANLLEDEIERRGLRLRNLYMSALWEICGCRGETEIAEETYWIDEWLLIRATPEQRAQAFLKVIV